MPENFTVFLNSTKVHIPIDSWSARCIMRHMSLVRQICVFFYGKFWRALGTFLVYFIKFRIGLGLVSGKFRVCVGYVYIVD